MTMYLHFLMFTPDVWSEQFSKDKKYHEIPNRYFRKSIPLVKYMAPYKEESMVNLLDDAPPVKTKEQEEAEKNEAEVVPHWKREIYVNLVTDNTPYSKTGGIPSEVAKNLQVDWNIDAYEPIIYMSDFWLLKRDMIELNDTLAGKSLNLTLNFQNYQAYYF